MPADSAQPSRKYVVAVDSREQLPYEWDGVACQEATLTAGDYSIVGMEADVSVERKSLADYWSCMGKRRFKDCLERLARIAHSCVVVEADSGQIFASDYVYWIPQRYGKVKRSRITGPVALAITRWNMVLYGVPIWFSGDRERGADFTLKFLDESYRLIRREARDAAKEAVRGKAVDGLV